MFGGELGFWELAIILIAGVVLFGKSLPDVGRSLGKIIAEFKKGLKGIEGTVDASLGGLSNLTSSLTQFRMPEAAGGPAAAPAAAPARPRRVATTAPKFQDEPIDPAAADRKLTAPEAGA
jgi:sec-independent protein translocase protein TatA